MDFTSDEIAGTIVIVLSVLMPIAIGLFMAWREYEPYSNDRD